MSEEFLFPDVGEGIAEGKLVEWKVSVGDEVAEDDVVADVETDKAVVEIPSPQAGTIQELSVEEGALVHVGDVLLKFGKPGESTKQQEPAESATKDLRTTDEEVAADHKRDPARGTKKVESSLTPTAPTPEAHEPPVTVEEQSSDAPAPVTNKPQRVLAAPSTRRLAREQGVDLASLEGSGPHGRILQSDVMQAANKSLSAPASQSVATSEPAKPVAKPAPASQSPTKQEVPPATPSSKQEARPSASTSVSYTGRRKAIGEHMQQSNQVPTVTEFAHADVSALVELREHLKSKAASLDVKLTYLAFFSKAVCAALKKFPALNSHFLDEEISLFEDVHLGIAVDAEDGLLVPVVRDANRKSVLEIAQAIEELALRVRSNDFSREEITGSTFSISSIGPLRVEEFTPKINTPETAILGIGGIVTRPWVVDEAVVAREVVALSLSFDHRVVDGAEAARFLDYLVELIEDPELLVLGGI